MRNLSGDAAEPRGALREIGYTAGFYREMAPSHLAFAALMAGRDPGAALRPSRMLELGFGQGFGLALLAASNPHIAFEGYDLQPDHVAQARGLIADAELDNLTVAEADLRHVAAAGAAGAARDVDVIALHGVLSWVSPETQSAIVEIVRQRLRPNGVLYVSYNCMPGWAPLAPIRQLARDMLRASDARSETGVADALTRTLEMLAALRQANAFYFAANPAVARHFDSMLTMDRRYLAHEYFSEHWAPLPFSDVADTFARAGLGYLASALLAENIEAVAVPAAARPLLAQAATPLLRETLRDLSVNKQFRRDIFGAAGAELSADARRARLARYSFTLAVPRPDVVLAFAGALGPLDGHPGLYSPIVDRLAEGPAPFDALLALPPFGEGRIGVLSECLTLLVHSGQVLPLAEPAADRPVDPAPAQRFNRMLVARARRGQVFDTLASPLTGTGLPVTEFGLLALAAVFDGVAPVPADAAPHAFGILDALGSRPFRDGAPIHDRDEAVAFLAQHLAPVLDQSLPLWRQHGIIPA